MSQHGESRQTREKLIGELDELRYTLHDSPEYQQDIPLLNEPGEQLDDDFDLGIPILTDSLEVSDTPSPATAPEPSGQGENSVTATQSDTLEPAVVSPGEPQPFTPETEPDLDLLDQLLDDLVAEQLPKLEKKLRGRLQQMIEQGQLDLLDNRIDED